MEQYVEMKQNVGTMYNPWHAGMAVKGGLKNPKSVMQMSVVVRRDGNRNLCLATTVFLAVSIGRCDDWRWFVIVFPAKS